MLKELDYKNILIKEQKLNHDNSHSILAEEKESLKNELQDLKTKVEDIYYYAKANIIPLAREEDNVIFWNKDKKICYSTQMLDQISDSLKFTFNQNTH